MTIVPALLPIWAFMVLACHLPWPAAQAQEAADPLYHSPSLGISTIDVDGSRWERDLRDAGITNGAILSRAAEPAKSAGLRRGDVLIAMGGVKINDSADVHQQLGTVWSIFNTLFQIRLLEQSLSGRAFGVGTTFSGFDAAPAG